MSDTYKPGQETGSDSDGNFYGFDDTPAAKSAAITGDGRGAIGGVGGFDEALGSAFGTLAQIGLFVAAGGMVIYAWDAHNAAASIMQQTYAVVLGGAALTVFAVTGAWAAIDSVRRAILRRRQIPDGR